MRLRSSGKNLCLMCEKCHNLLHVDLIMSFNKTIETHGDFNIEFSEYYYCDFCKEYTFHDDIDYYIADIISYLNKNGIVTKFCCQGHCRANPFKFDNHGYAYFDEESPLSSSLPYIVIVEDLCTNKELLNKFKSIDSKYWHSMYDVVNDEYKDHVMLSIRFKYSIIEDYEEKYLYDGEDLRSKNMYDIALSEQKIFNNAIDELSSIIMPSSKE